MGSCISRPKKRYKKTCNSHVHDKLVISQNPNIISSVPADIITLPSQKFVSPPHSSSSTSSNFSSSFSCSNTVNSSSSSSVLSTSTKDRSFSSEFLISCIKDNPHVIAGLTPPINNTVKFESSSAPTVQISKQSVQERPMIVKKRARSSSPSLVRQKSYRKEQSSPNRGLIRSPSPSRRHSTESNRSFSTNGFNESYYRRPIIPKATAINSVSSGVKRDNMQRSSFASPNHDLMINSNFSMKRKDTITQQIGKLIDGDVKCNQKMDVVMDDINNPLIALDCFIFL